MEGFYGQCSKVWFSQLDEKRIECYISDGWLQVIESEVDGLVSKTSKV